MMTWRRWMASRWGLVVVALLAGGALGRGDGPATQTGKSKGFFWKVTSPTTEVYLLGSMHLASPEFYPLSPDIEGAFKDSTVLVVEADITKVNQLALAAQLMQQGMYAGGDTLDKHVSAETYKQVEAFCKNTVLPIDTIRVMKPFMASLMMTALAAKQIGMDSDLGIDKHFLDAAKGKKIVELESADAQVKLLMSFNDKQQEAALVSTAKEAGHLKEELQKLIKVWRTGDVTGMDHMMAEDYGTDADSQAVMKAMLYDRNDKMAEKIAELLKGKERVFVVVGAAHLVGDKGIIKQLERRNFAITRPDLAVPGPAAATKP